MTVTWMLWDAPPSQARQRLRLDPPINTIHECGIGIPMSTLVDLVKQSLRESIRDECPGGHTCVPKNTHASASIELGSDGCPTDTVTWGQNAENARCEMQQAFQEASASISEFVGEGVYQTIDLFLDPGATYPSQKYRTTITVSGGDPERLIWRVPDSEVFIDPVRIALLTNPELVAEYGVHLICDLGNNCQDDSDLDGWCDDADCCPEVFNLHNDPGCTDSDGDGVPDVCDNCPSAQNPGQLDLDYDLLGDECDPDRDGDGVLNGHDCDDLNPWSCQRATG